MTHARLIALVASLPLAIASVPAFAQIGPLPVTATAEKTAEQPAAAATDADTTSGMTASVTESQGSLETGLLKMRKFEQNSEITDAKLKADSGSLSRFSAKFNLSYYGPTIDDFSKREQPNPDNGVGVYSTSLKGSISTRFRIDKDSTVGLGTGLNALTPMHGVQRTDVNDPYVSYDLTDRWGPLQTRNSFSASYITVPNYKAVGEYSSLGWDISLVHVVNDSKFAVNFDSSFGYYLYNRDYIRKDGRAQRLNWALYPGVKYNVTDKLNVNTSLSISYLNPRSLPDQWALWNKTVTQRIGIGWAIQRDIYISPYLNVLPTKLAINTTTFNISTVFSIL